MVKWLNHCHDWHATGYGGNRVLKRDAKKKRGHLWGTTFNYMSRFSLVSTLDSEKSDISYLCA